MVQGRSPIEGIVREKTEWSDIRWDSADDASIDRVLLIGDSIACSYSPTVIERLQGIAHVDRLANSRSINDPALLKEVFYVLGEYRYVAIHFNNGLHGLHLSDEGYARNLRYLVQVLVQYGQGARLIWASSTPIRLSGSPSAFDEDRNAIVLSRNARAREIMQDCGIPIGDLYGLVADRPELSEGDAYHYNDEGRVVLGNAVAEALLRVLTFEAA